MTEQKQRIVKTCNCCGKGLGYEDICFIEFKVPHENEELFDWGSYAICFTCFRITQHMVTCELQKYESKEGEEGEAAKI
jgi:hypothetical protein